MLEIVSNHCLNHYLKNDWIFHELNLLRDEKKDLYTTDTWLLSAPAKRCIFNLLYGDLRNASTKMRVLDVGGGLSCFAWSQFEKIDYKVLDLFHHESPQALHKFSKAFPSAKLIHSDWEQFEITNNYDLIIANDLFPNVDQRVDEFIEKFSSHTTEIRLSLTYYNQRRCYQVKRVDADEVFFIRPWNGQQLHTALSPFMEPIQHDTFERLTLGKESIFENGRQICTISIKGGYKK